MTTPFERTRAVIQTREFLQELQSTPQMPESVRVEAKRLLRHYPSLAELNTAHSGAPEWWGPVPPFSHLSGTAAAQSVIDATKKQG